MLEAAVYWSEFTLRKRGEQKELKREEKALFFFPPQRFDKNVTRAHACIRKLVAPPLFFFVVSIFFQSSQPAHEILRPIIG